ncbi:efflux transporter outer membrane subunit [Segetibacter sp. 3557_3]|uniref:efflux transporter outer membrane subunit n=1 Tax=Segetibacter sp. 3557_3 TaxID=2547429 RepID=UPI00105918D3|nr:efflux transporter outer membrane subunit [Segetibacter sp. 3557_3]TDH24526.1 efflux transporter outer membrane subunit [Segetibacter sp. 3557_3]
MNLIKNGFLLLVIVAVFNACNVTKPVAPPAIDLPSKFRNDSSEKTSGIAELEWKRFFKDPILQQLIQKAISRNYDMQLALKNIEYADLQLKQTRWSYLPDARLQVTANTNRPSDNSLNGLSAKQFLGSTHVEDYSANINLSWEADIWGKIKNQRAAALAGYLQTEEAKKAVQTNIVAAVAQGYANLLRLDAQLAIARKNIALNDSTLNIIRLQFTAGQVNALAVQQAEAQHLSAAGLVPSLEKEIAVQENALSILAGTLPGRIQRNSLDNGLSWPGETSAGLPAEMVSRRPDVKRYELALSIANAQAGIAKAAMYPSLSITAAGGLNTFTASNWFNVPASLFGIVAGSIAQPLLQKKQLTTAYNLALVNREKSVIQFRQAVLTAVGEVSDALVKVEKLQFERQLAITRVNTLQQAIVNANMLFKTGMANYLEVITAQEKVLESELQLAAITFEQTNAKTELYRALGGGWR